MHMSKDNYIEKWIVLVEEGTQEGMEWNGEDKSQDVRAYGGNDNVW